MSALGYDDDAIKRKAALNENGYFLPEGGRPIAYSRKYDAYYYSDTGDWIEGRCDDRKCIYCTNRPEKYKIRTKENHASE